MGYTTGTGPKGLDTFNNTAQTAADLNRLVALIARGANFRIDLSSVRNALTGTDLVDGMYFVETDTDQVYVREGGAWRNANHIPTRTQKDLTNSIENTITQVGRGKITGNNTVQVTEAVTFPVPFAGTPTIICQAAGYRNPAGAYNDTGLSGSTNFATAGVQNANGFTVLLTQSGGTLSSGIDWYYNWIAIGVPA